MLLGVEAGIQQIHVVRIQAHERLVLFLFLGTVHHHSLARFLVHYVVGATVWAAYMPDEFFGMSMHSPWFYSLLYNLAYMLPNIIICLVVFAAIYRPLGKYLRGEDLKKA